jgi:hypothetical protein
VNWIHLAQNRNHVEGCFECDVIKNLRFPQKAGNFLAAISCFHILKKNSAPWS